MTIGVPVSTWTIRGFMTSSARRVFRRVATTAVFCFVVVSPFAVRGRSVSGDEAKMAVANWLKQTDSQGCGLSNEVESVTTYVDEVSSNAIHVVHLENEGFVIASGDDEVEPILGFADSGICSIDRKSPLWALLCADVACRRRAATAANGASGPLFASAVTSAAKETAAQKARKKWRKLLGNGLLTAFGNGKKTGSIMDIRQSPLLKTSWGQERASLIGPNCYNYYTPGNCPCGCVATAMAQLMKYHAWPQDEVTSQMRECSYNGEMSTFAIKGGVYDWANMPNNPDGASQEVREKIGRLTYDCGVSVGMQYGSKASGAYVKDVPDALLNVFGYASAYYCEGFNACRLRANLNACCPVLLSILGEDGHAIVADGYGYTSDETEYFHLNMGWDGTDNLWYNLDSPVRIAAGWDEYDEIKAMVYNVFPKKRGGIVSGRVLDESGSYVEGVIVEAYDEQERRVVAQTKSDNRGLYAFILPPGEYELVAVVSYEDDGWEFLFSASCPAVVRSEEDASDGYDITITPISWAVDELWVWGEAHEYATGGDAPWRYEFVAEASSGDAARSGQVAAKGESWFETTFPDEGKLTFRWKVSSEPDCDFLRFYVDGREVSAISGTNGEWQTVSVCVTNTVQDDWSSCGIVCRWCYSKDAYVDCGEDCGWVDDVQWHPAVSERFDASDRATAPSFSYYESFTCYEGDPRPAPPRPERSGYVFSGWFETEWSDDGPRTNWYPVGKAIAKDTWYELWRGYWIPETKPRGLTLPETWLDRYGLVENGNYAFAANGRTRKTGCGGETFVWQDFVAGTDPTNETSMFKAIIEIVDGKPVVSWEPKLSPEEAALRTYTTYGCSELGGEWVDVDRVSDEVKGALRFFRVGVDMK